MEDYLVNLISGIAGTILSMIFEWFPKLKTWYDPLSKGQKAGVMFIMVILVSAAIFGLSCSGWLNGLIPGLSVTCDQEGIQLLVRVFFLVIVSNQVTFLFVNKPSEKK